MDTDRREIRRNLRDVSAPSPAGNLPTWLPEYPGALPTATPGPNAPAGSAYVIYTSGAEPDLVFAHYELHIREAGVRITYTTRQPGRGGAIHAEDSARRAVVSVSPGPRGTSISVNWQPAKVTPPAIPSSARLTAVWFDDSNGILRLRDPATGKEYDLGMATMLRYARSQPLAPSARADFPAWLAFYPGAKVVTAMGPPPGWHPQKFSDMRSYRIEMESSATVAEIAAFYKETLVRHGLTIERETQSEDRGYSLQARTADRMHLVDVEVRRRSRATSVRLIDHYTTPRP